MTEIAKQEMTNMHAVSQNMPKPTETSGLRFEACPLEVGLEACPLKVRSPASRISWTAAFRRRIGMSLTRLGKPNYTWTCVCRIAETQFPVLLCDSTSLETFERHTTLSFKMIPIQAIFCALPTLQHCNVVLAMTTPRSEFLLQQISKSIAGLHSETSSLLSLWAFCWAFAVIIWGITSRSPGLSMLH